MKALLVDDEPLARRELRRLLADFDWIEIVGEAGNISEAQQAVDTLAPELLFLDIQMPGGSGFDLLTRLDHVPRVIFTTAYDHHAVHAFEVNALDYLLKPIEPERLASALARARGPAPPASSGNTAASQTVGQAAATNVERLFIRDGSRCWFVPLREVSLMVAEGNYVRLHWGDARPLLARPLSSLEERLDSHRYFRANRRQIINLEFIESVEMGNGGLLHVQLRGGPEVEVSRRQARLFRAQMSV
ncbi:MAG: response regulator [Pseudomonadota bacterium]|nr:response regulator [Pseudomonadota bacterium]